MHAAAPNIRHCVARSSNEVCYHLIPKVENCDLNVFIVPLFEPETLAAWEADMESKSTTISVQNTHMALPEQHQSSNKKTVHR